MRGSTEELLFGSHGSKMTPSPPPLKTTKKENYEPISENEKEISSLMEDIQRLECSLNQLRESSASQIRVLEDQLDEKSEIISRLEARLESQRDYEDIQRELISLRSHTRENNNGSPINNGYTPPSHLPKEGKEKRTNSPGSSLIPRYLLEQVSLQPESLSSLLSDELALNWRRSLERSLLSSPPHSHHNNNNNHPHSHHINNMGNNQNSSSAPPTPLHSPPLDGGSTNESMGNMDSLSLLNGSLGGERMGFRFEDSLIPKSDPMEARLQEMLRYNMDKFGSQCLDTLQIARRVRELLSIHNIGQRLFAKYVLGLSQGTVSELLSKPKPWDKLTEKGRDSYRKMHAWAADEASVLLLKSLIPKKGKEGPSGGSLSGGYRGCDDERGSDDKIAALLSEATHVLSARSSAHPLLYPSSHPPRGEEEETGSKSPDTNGLHNGYPLNGPPSPSSSSNSRERRMRKYENDDISGEQVARIYQEQLAKLVGLRLSHGLPDSEARVPPDAFGSMLFPHLFGGIENEEFRLVLDVYHRELSKIAASSSSSSAPTPTQFRPLLFNPLHPNAPLNNNNSTNINNNHHHHHHHHHSSSTPLPPHSVAPAQNVQDLSLPKRASSSPDLNDNEENVDESEETSEGGGRGMSSAFSLVRPKESQSGAQSPLDSILHPSGDDSSNASPLQRMASITNSLISQPTTPSVSSPNQRPLKAVLPPITQQQFDQYNNLNTEDIVRKVKEQLSQYSISQRLFGESVLGLSQGSVSDLLARPKPWHMLTQKGREPFIRMKMFLEDDNAVHKLVASQYKIAPEKLMRTGGYSGNPSPTNVPMSKSVPSSNLKLDQLSSKNSICPNESPPVPSQPLISPQQPPPPPPIPIELIKKSPSSTGRGGTSSPGLSSMRSSGHGPQQPSVYEMAALTQDLDTQLITTRIKEALLANNIGQKIFGEVVLGLSQGSVSELLSKPKPWHMLSIKGREPFIRMQLWLADGLNIERLQHLKNERREANKRKRGGHNHSSSHIDPYASGTQGSSDASNDSPNESYSPSSGNTVTPSKKQRVLFTDEQKEALKLAFSLDSYPNVSAIEFLGRELTLSSRTITNWFHNHRMRLKQQTSTPSFSEGVMSSQPFDPIQFRLLLKHRLIELHRDKYLPMSFFASSNKNLLEEGLDLTVSNNVSRIPSDYDDDEFDDGQDDEASSDGCDSTTSTGSKSQVRRKRKSIRKLDLHIAGSGAQRPIKFSSVTSGGSSRRKPIAPQWLNPSWHDDSEDEEVLINGVCVVQNSLNYEKEEEEENFNHKIIPNHSRKNSKESSNNSIKMEPKEEVEFQSGGEENECSN